MTAPELMALLRVRYSAPAWLLLENVRSETGVWPPGRYADALACGITPKSSPGGPELHGFEVKVSRADWLRELRDPGKAYAVMRYCDRWWLVASDPAIIQPEELPRTWGLLVPRGRGLGVAVCAPLLTPAPVSRLFLASLLRSAGEVRTGFERAKKAAP